MARHQSGAGDPVRSLRLLWQDPETPVRRARGPRPALRLVEIVETALREADASGIDAVSMRRLADSLGVGAMSLYTYVPGKSELVDLMVDAAHRTLYRESSPRDLPGWRDRLDLVAWENWHLYRRHPWLLDVDVSSRPTLGPGTTAKYDSELAAVDGIGLDDLQMDSVVALVVGHAQTSARAAEARTRTRLASAHDDEEWWRRWEPELRRVLDPTRFPLATRVGQHVGEATATAHDPERSFVFGLNRILDGVAQLIAAGGGDNAGAT
ncbi:TetR/AcrR family transcriptional regulator C-terminal domain-containing protein [Spiractinospora alimapuensis]|uniref:TetR/AcrR family transcriptional regulator n=1 Tax=Spiractinospora alimapuensis TaxID=2820884 RepID=UPI001F374A42|nr:TetR/AcrR family transcriptional regulator [Spiractinospora alimapuensis]QVQ52611.1 TetR/AcrR family transcriptional regulator C-terminal domain-containing protein [Spiractinospora alimapuensis]